MGQLRQFLGTVYYLAKTDRSTLGVAEYFHVGGYSGSIESNKEMPNVHLQGSLHPTVSVDQVSALFPDPFTSTYYFLVEENSILF